MAKTVKYYVQSGIPMATVVVKKGMTSFPLMAILTIIFVVAKLFDKLDWSWFVVFWPLWITPVIILGVLVSISVGLILLVCGAFLWDMVDEIKRRRK
jgi:hypothetical protein